MSLSQSQSVNMFEDSSEGGGDSNSKGGQSERGVEEGCLVDREREGGGWVGRRGRAKCAQYSFKLTEAVCVLVCTSHCSLLLALFRSLSCMLSLSCQTVCSFQQQEEGTEEPVERKKERERV